MEQTFDTPGPVTLAMQVTAGDIELRAEDTETTRVEITGYDDATPPRVTCDPAPGGGYHVNIDHRVKKTWGFSFSRGLDITLVVPTGTTLDGSIGAADLEVRGTVGAIAFRAGAGDVRFDDVTGDVQIACGSGDIEGRSVGGHLSFKGASGDIEVGRVGAGATVRSASGDIEIGRIDGPTTITVGSGDIDLRDLGPGTVTVRAVAGDVHVGVREGMGVWLDVGSASGDVHSALESVPRAEDRGDPDLQLTINTVSGDIDIARIGARRG